MRRLHLYFADDPLSSAELTAACLDGHLVALGEAYIPADAVETAALRAGSLSLLLGKTLAAAGRTAAWVHGALIDPPARHRVQRVSVRRLHHVVNRQLEYHDTRLPEHDVMVIGGVCVTTPVRTLVDLARSAREIDHLAARALLRARVVRTQEGTAWLEAAGIVPGKRRAHERLRSWAVDQPDVTR